MDNFGHQYRAGTHPSTGKHIKVMGISIIHFEESKIRDEWIASN